MATEQRDLEWFLENDMEITDEQEAELALNGVVEIESGQPVLDPSVEEDETEIVPPVETPPETPAEPKAATPPVETPPADVPDDKAAAGLDDEPLGIATQDGKGVIPYKVLRGSRDQVNDLQTENADLQTKIDTLEQAAAAPPPGQVAPVTTEITDEVVAAEFEKQQGMTLEKFRDEYGEDQANLFLSPIKHGLVLEQRLDALQDNIANREAGEEALAQNDTRIAIDANPTLADWEQNDPVMWEAAKAVDNLLKQDEEWLAKPLGERFNEVVKRLGATTAPTPPPPAEKTAEEIAAEKLATAKGSSTPTSLSSIPGGTPAAETLRDQTDGMSESELINAMATPEKQAELLASLS